MAQRPKRAVDSALESKGFSRVENDHSWFVYFTKDGKKSRAKTKTSHYAGGTSLGDPLLGAMAKQCFLSKKEFLDLVDCPMDREKFEGLLSERGKV